MDLSQKRIYLKMIYRKEENIFLKKNVIFKICFETNILILMTLV